MDDLNGGACDEAYTIGVRLALEDGVSLAIAALEAEMALFGRALAEMPGLGSAAAALSVARVGAVQAQVAPEMEDAYSPRAPVVRDVAAPVGVTPVEATRVEATRAAVAPERGFERPGPERRVAASPVALGAAPPVMPMARAEGVPGRALAPVLESFAGLPVAAERGSDLTVSRMLEPVVLPLERSVAPVGGQANRGASAAGGAAASGVSGGELSASPVMPGSSWAPSMAAALPQVAPVAVASGESSGGGGPVYLDGRLLGHWVSEHLAREAGRPMAGGVGFDGRMGPAWPGALQGG